MLFMTKKHGMVALTGALGLWYLRRGGRGRCLGIGAAMGAVFTFWMVVPVVAALAVLVWLLLTRERRTPAPA